MFTPIETTLGALLLHHASSSLLFNNGCVLGASGFLRGFFALDSMPKNGLFLLGMASSVRLVQYVLPGSVLEYPTMGSNWPSALFVLGTGLLTGWGTKGCGGCTSGHMLCGVSQLSGRSILATAIFFPTAMLTFNLAQPFLGDAIQTCSAELPCYTPVLPSKGVSRNLLAVTLGIVATSELASRALDRYTKPSTARFVTYFLTGVEFGLGLLLSGLSSPLKVLGFFAVRPVHNWDPSLAMIILFGLVPNLLVNQVKGFEQPPRFDAAYCFTKKTLKDVDYRFVAGAAAFGIAWGLSGTCPGPGILRAVAQPIWGLLWIGGFWLGTLIQ